MLDFGGELKERMKFKEDYEKISVMLSLLDLDLYGKKTLANQWAITAEAHVIQADAMINDQELEPVDNVGIEEPQFQWGPELQEDPIPAVPLQEIPLQEEGIDAEAMDLENLELQEDLPEIVMDEEEEEQVDVEDDPEEIMFDEEDWEVFSNVSSE
ncbi:hypothetical protein TIFTF001_054257 [Ficus carica]|uniref:Uncharacterized protein n=1 Tax=Ficus carica TaxID=3494 RepID=A0AA88JGC4_FICCA|nr:hypothetical protein TIFTF001_054257 [Ficus carica]